MEDGTGVSLAIGFAPVPTLIKASVPTEELYPESSVKVSLTVKSA